MNGNRRESSPVTEATSPVGGHALRPGRRCFFQILALLTAACTGCPRREEASPPAGAAPAPGADAEPAPAEAPPPEEAERLPPTRPGALRFLALGDSYTIGESVAPADRWPVQLARALREGGTDVDEPHVIARTGWRTDDLDAAVTRANPPGPYDLVSLLIGVNDQYQGRPPAEYRKRFPALLRRAIDLAGGRPGRVIVLSIPDWSATPFAERGNAGPVARAIDEFNTINRAASERAGVRYVDVTPLSRLAPEQPDLIADDRLHPSGRMYAEWVKLALPAAKAALVGPELPPGAPAAE